MHGACLTLYLEGLTLDVARGWLDFSNVLLPSCGSFWLFCKVRLHRIWLHWLSRWLFRKWFGLILAFYSPDIVVELAVPLHLSFSFQLSVTYWWPATFLHYEAQEAVTIVERFLEIQLDQLILYVLRVLSLERYLHLLRLENLQFREWLLRVEEFESLILRFLADEHIKLRVLQSPDVNFLVDLLI